MAGFDIEKLDGVIHGRLRLGVMAYLADAEVASFNELKAVLKVTQGNHSIQLHKLEDGASRALRRIPAIVSFLNPQPALILVGGNRRWISTSYRSTPRPIG